MQIVLSHQKKVVPMPSFYNDCLTRDQNVFFVVDDDHFITSLALSVLSGYGQAIDFKDSKDLIREYEEVRPNIVFLDIHLGESNGIDILKKIKEVDEDAFVYMLSSDSTLENIEQCKQLGAKGFIGKPFARKSFIDAFDKCPTTTISHQTRTHLG